jgi:single stranded DNA-binding protein
MSFQVMVVIGNVGSVGELHKAGNSNVCNFSVAVNGRDDQGPTWYQVAAFGPLGERCAQHLKKGEEVMVTGRLEAKRYEKNGVVNTVLEVTAETVSVSTIDISVVHGCVEDMDCPRKEDGAVVIRLRLRVDRHNGTRPSETYQVVTSGRLAEMVAKHVTLGRTVTVVGRLRMRTTERDGKPVTVTELVAEQLRLGGRYKDSNNTAVREGRNSANVPATSEPDQEKENPGNGRHAEFDF